MKLLDHPREVKIECLKLGQIPVNKVYMGTVKKLVRKHYNYLDVCDRYEAIYGVPMNYYTQDEVASWSYLSHDIVKEQAILIEIGNELPWGTYYYIDIDRLKNFIDIIKMHRALYLEEYSISKHSLVMSTNPVGVESLFVDPESLQPLYKSIQQYKDDYAGKITVKELKKITPKLRK